MRALLPIHWGSRGPATAMSANGVITLQGKPYEFRYTFNLLARFENLVGHSILETDLKSVSDIRALLFAALKENDQVNSVEQTGQLMDGEDFLAIGRTLREAVDKALMGARTVEEVEKKMEYAPDG